MELVWQLPEPVSVHEVPVDGETSIFLRRRGDPDGLRLVLSHGNGLAIDLYDPFWSLLPPIQGSRFAALVLYDPPVCKPGRSHREFEAAAVQAAGFARRRAEKFQRREEFSDILTLLPPFQRFAPGVFELMAKTTLRASEGEDGYELRCPREYEARIIDYASVYGVAVDFDALKCPAKVIGADPTLPFSYLPSLDLSDILSVDYDFLPEATHFLQLEKPGECAAVLKEFLGSVDLC